MNPQKLRILIADDHPLICEALRFAVDNEEDMEVTGEANDGSTAVELAAALEPDVIIMDLYMPDMSGLEASARILETNPDARILMLTSSTDDDKVVAAFQTGLLGYVLKGSHKNLLVEGIREVAQGNLYIPPDAAKKMGRAIRSQSNRVKKPLPGGLTPREHDVVSLVAEGFSNHEVAEQLFLSESTVRVHVANILHKLKLESRSRLVRFVSHQT
jgi:NarL family two-component system response regulator LiaR